MDWENIFSTFASGLVGEWAALALVSVAMEFWRRRRAGQMRAHKRVIRQSDELRVSVTLTKDQILALQACVQALAIQAEAEMKLLKAEALHELDRELVQVVGRMTCTSVMGMTDLSELIGDDSRLQRP